MLAKIRRLKEKKGFTLVELIVVIAIIAILTAIIVPLVSKYTTQAAYTSLQSSASAIETMFNAGISAYCMNGGTPFPAELIIGRADAYGTPKGDDIKVCQADGVTAVGEESVVKKLKDSIESGLFQKLSPNSGFVLAVKNGGVNGVIYNPEGEVADKCTISTIDGYDEAYQVGSVACGMLGIYRKAAIEGGETGVTLNEGYVVP